MLHLHALKTFERDYLRFLVCYLEQKVRHELVLNDEFDTNGANKAIGWVRELRQETEHEMKELEGKNATETSKRGDQSLPRG